MTDRQTRSRAARYDQLSIVLLIVCVVLWLTSQVFFVRGRTKTFNYAVADGADLDVGGPPANLVRRMLGDLTVKRIVIDREHSSPQLEGWVRHYFPEAKITFR